MNKKTFLMCMALILFAAVAFPVVRHTTEAIGGIVGNVASLFEKEATFPTTTSNTKSVFVTPETCLEIKSKKVLIRDEFEILDECGRLIPKAPLPPSE